MYQQQQVVDMSSAGKLLIPNHNPSPSTPSHHPGALSPIPFLSLPALHLQPPAITGLWGSAPSSMVTDPTQWDHTPLYPTPGLVPSTTVVKMTPSFLHQVLPHPWLRASHTFPFFTVGI